MHRGRHRGTVVGVLLVALPRRFRGRFLTTKRRFVEPSWRYSGMEVSWMHRERRRGTVVGVLLVALPRRCRGRFLTTKRRFVETVVALSWRGNVVDGVVALLWACCWSPCHDGFVETVVAMSWRGSVVDALWMMLWDFPGRVASCPAMTVLWKPSWHPNVHDRGHCR